MIKPSDLRIGNYVIVFNYACIQIKNGLDIDNYIQYDPIPLTKEWHLKFGAIETKPGEFLYKFDGMRNFIFIPNRNQDTKDDDDKIGIFKYVHMWQNHVYFLHGVELTIKE